MIQQKGPGRSFSRMLSKNSLLVVLSNEVLRQGTTSAWHGWLPWKPLGCPSWCLGRLVAGESCYGDSNRACGSGRISLVQKLGNLLPWDYSYHNLRLRLAKAWLRIFPASLLAWFKSQMHGANPASCLLSHSFYTLSSGISSSVSPLPTYHSSPLYSGYFYAF